MRQDGFATLKAEQAGAHAMLALLVQSTVIDLSQTGLVRCPALPLPPWMGDWAGETRRIRSPADHDV